VIVTPNVDSLGHRHFASAGAASSSRAIFLYSSASLRALFGRIGVGPVEVFTSRRAATTSCARAGTRAEGAGRAVDYLAIWRLQRPGRRRRGAAASRRESWSRGDQGGGLRCDRRRRGRMRPQHHRRQLQHRPPAGRDVSPRSRRRAARYRCRRSWSTMPRGMALPPCSANATPTWN
jgi:hypothetical protein